jgi:hypothetical protein
MYHPVPKVFYVVLPLLLVAGCGGSSSTPNPPPDDPPPPVTQVALQGGGVKGPLAGAQVVIYAVDTTADDWKGAEIDAGSTDTSAAIIDLEIPETTSGPVLLEFTADADTLDIITAAPPVLTVMLTVVDASRVTAGEAIYASPLTTLAVAIAIANADTVGLFGGNGDGTTSADEAHAAIAAAGQQVATTLGFSLLDDVDIFTTSPLLTPDTDQVEEQSAVAAYRTAIEAATALIQAVTDESLLNNPASTVNNDEVLMALARDLTDGSIDGSVDGSPIAELADVVDIATTITQDPTLLSIPGTDILVGDIETVLVSELETTGVAVDTTALADGSANADPTAASTVPDSDGDSVKDDLDNCVDDANSDQLDTDSDTAGNVCDPDDDNDDVPDADDSFPLDATESIDTDGDGTGNNADSDDDGDGSNDVDDAFPLDASESLDTDGDQIGNNADTDDDNDGTDDENDSFPLDPAESTDTDGDGVGNNSDADDDNDGVDDIADFFPLDPNETADADGDGIGDNGDNCPTIENTDQQDSNGDGVGDACPGSTLWDNFNWDDADWQ